MNKIAFIGIILIIGLFSLQYALLGSRSEQSVTAHKEVPVFQNIQFAATQHVQVVYICPGDTARIQKLEEERRLKL